jgi:hypothetical protein
VTDVGPILSLPVKPKTDEASLNITLSGCVSSVAFFLGRASVHHPELTASRSEFVSATARAGVQLDFWVGATGMMAVLPDFALASGSRALDTSSDFLVDPEDWQPGGANRQLDCQSSRPKGIDIRKRGCLCRAAWRARHA